MAKLFFENRFILTKKLYGEYCTKTFVSMHKKNRALAFGLAGGFGILTTLCMIFLPFKLLIAIGITLTIYFLYMGIWGYHFSEWIQFRKMQDEQGDVLLHQVRFCSDQIYVKLNQTSLTFKYSSITKAYETEHLLILIIGIQGMVEHGQIIFKEGFLNQEEDTVKQWKAFINEKTKREIF